VLQLSSGRYDNAYLTLKNAIDHGANAPFFYRNLGFLEMFYKIDRPAALKAWNKYLALGGDSFSLVVRKAMAGGTP
jgi:hypothetical protein